MESDVPTSINGLWDVIAMMVLLIFVVIGLCLWGLWIVFCSNMTSRSGRKKNKGNGKSLEEHNETDHTMIGENDTDCLLDNEVKLEIKDEPAKETATKNVSDALKCKPFSAAQDIQKSRRHQSTKPKKYVGKLKYKLEYDFTRKTLNVTVIQCSDLPAMDFNGSSDPYVKLYLMPEVEAKFRTLVHHKTLNPVFNEIFSFENISYRDTIDKIVVFNVFDYDWFSKNDYIGEVQVPLSTIDLAQTIEEWKDISLVKNDQYLGDICLNLRYVPSSGKLTVGILECKNLKKMDITGSSDPYVKIKLLDQKGKRIGEKKKTSVKMQNLNPYFNESFVFFVKEELLREVTLELTVCDYDKIGSSEFIGKVSVGYNRKGVELQHWREMLKTPRHSAVQWHVLKNLGYNEEDEYENWRFSSFKKCKGKKKAT